MLFFIAAHIGTIPTDVPQCSSFYPTQNAGFKKAIKWGPKRNKELMKIFLKGHPSYWRSL
jgi:hypothetical protein